MADLRSKVMDQLTCLICRELFKTPKQLDCLHRFCEDCLHQYITSRNFRYHTGVVCPTCRHISKLKTRRVEQDQLAKQIPTDFQTASLCEILREDSEICTLHNRQVLVYCQQCQTCVCPECEHDCGGFVPLNVEVKNRKDKLNDQQATLRKSVKQLREQIKVTKKEKKLVEKNYNLSAAKVKREYTNIRTLLDEQEELHNEYLRDVRDNGLDKLRQIEKSEKKRLRLISNTQKKISNAVSTKSSVRFIEKTQNPFENFGRSEVDDAIIPGSHAQQTNITVRKVKLEKIRKQIKRIVPDLPYRNRNSIQAGGEGLSFSVSEDSDSASPTHVMSPPLTPFSQNDTSNYFPSSPSTSGSNPTPPCCL